MSYFIRVCRIRLRLQPTYIQRSWYSKCVKDSMLVCVIMHGVEISVARTKSGMRGAAECIRTNITMTKKARVLERLEP